MSAPSVVKPSSKFRVVLRQEDTPATNTGSRVVSAERSPCVAQGPPPLAANSTRGVVEDAHGSGAAVPRRYGGAIVRVSELQKVGGVLPFTATHTEGRPGRASKGKTGTLPAVSWQALGISSNSTAEMHPPLSSASARGRGGGGGRAYGRATRGHPAPQRAGEATNRRTISGSRTGNRRTKGRGRVGSRRTTGTRRGARRGEAAMDSFQLRSDGQPYAHSWSTVKGRRRLHYNGKTFTGKTAHVIWGKIKDVLSSLSSSAPLPSVATETMGRRGVASRKRARAEVESGPSAVTSTTVSRSAPPSLPAPVGFKLLLDDEESLPEKGPTAGVVVLSDSENDDATTSSTSSTLSSWPSLRAGSSELTTSESSLCSEDEDDSKSSSHWRESPLKKRRRCPSVPKEKQPEVVERDGWLYPAELLPLLCEPDQGGASPSLKGCATATVSAGSTVDNNVESCFHTVAEEDRRARGITILGQSVSGMASPPTTSSRSAVAPPHIAAYSQRYEEMDALADLPGTDAEGLFVVGDEIGGMRFAP